MARSLRNDAGVFVELENGMADALHPKAVTSGLPKPNGVPVDEGRDGAEVALPSSGLEVLYFCASLANIS